MRLAFMSSIAYHSFAVHSTDIFRRHCSSRSVELMELRCENLKNKPKAFLAFKLWKSLSKKSLTEKGFLSHRLYCGRIPDTVTSFHCSLGKVFAAA
jgi:hypothetical protein